MFKIEPILTSDEVPIVYDIVWPNAERELLCSSPNNKWNKIRGYNITSSNVANVETEIEECKFILNEFIPSKETEYFKFKNLVSSSSIEKDAQTIKPITSAYQKIIEIKNFIYKKLEDFLKYEENFGEKERAWLDFMKWGANGFLNDVMHDLEIVEGYENSEYYEESLFILKKFNII